MRLDVSWNRVEARLRELGETGAAGDPSSRRSDEILEQLGFLRDGQLAPRGNALFMARFVLDDRDAARASLREALERSEVATAFCEALWGRGRLPVGGAVTLLKRLTASDDEASARRWLELMNSAGLIRYNRRNPTLEVEWNPHQLASPEEDAEKERHRGHVLTPEAKYGNVLALRELLRATRGFLYWWEQHMEAKVLEVLYRNLESDQVRELRLLSGPANVDDRLRSDFKRFRADVQKTKGIEAHWRVVPKKVARLSHGRFFMTEDLTRNLPPLNLILGGTNDEILPSEFGPDDFEEWWTEGVDLFAWTD